MDRETLKRVAEAQQPKWCEIHQHYKPCVHNPEAQQPEAGCRWSTEHPNTCVEHQAPHAGGGGCWNVRVAAAHARGVAEERERCAKVAEEWARSFSAGARHRQDGMGAAYGCTRVAQDIRAAQEVGRG